jgi:hypothetical protein
VMMLMAIHHHLHRYRAEGSSNWYLFKSSDDRSDSWDLESVTYHYSKQGYKIE